MWFEIARTAGMLAGFVGLLGTFGWWMRRCEKKALEIEKFGPGI